MKTYNECHPTVRAHENATKSGFSCTVWLGDALLRCFKTT